MKSKDGFERPRTLDEVGAQLGVTRERVRQIEKVALRKLRRLARKHGLTVEDLRD